MTETTQTPESSAGSNAGPLPDIIVIGSMKCATSSICNFLERHPDVFFLPGAEPEFFSKDERWSGGVDAYRALFRDAPEGARVGEGSNSYSMVDQYPDAPARIKDVIPHARLIYSVRHPVERMVSVWGQLRFQSPDLISYDINRAVRENPAMLAYPSYFNRLLDAYEAQFAADQIWVGYMEDLKADAASFYGALCDHCGVAMNEAALQSDAWKNKTEGRRIASEKYSALRAVPGVRALAKIAPTGLKEAVKSKLRRPTPSTKELLEKLDLPDDIRRDLKQDARAFLARTGKPADFWKFAF